MFCVKKVFLDSGMNISKRKCTGAMASIVFDGTFRLMLSLSTLSDMMHGQILKKKVTQKLKFLLRCILKRSLILGGIFSKRSLSFIEFAPINIPLV